MCQWDQNRGKRLRIGLGSGRLSEMESSMTPPNYAAESYSTHIGFMSINLEVPIHYLTPTNESNKWSLSSGDARTAGTNLTLFPQALIDARPEYVVLAGWMHVFGDDFRSVPILTSPNPVWSSQSLALESAVDADLSPRDERLRP